MSTNASISFPPPLAPFAVLDPILLHVVVMWCRNVFVCNVQKKMRLKIGSFKYNI